MLTSTYFSTTQLASSSRALDPAVVGEEHYRVARGVQAVRWLVERALIESRFAASE